MDKAHSVCFTGYRRIRESDKKEIIKRMKYAMMDLYGEGFRTFYCGGALGFDTLAAIAVIQMKAKYSDVRLVLALPCQTQTYRWQQKDIDLYEQIKGKADNVIYISDDYTPTCLHERNRFMADHSSVCIAYCTDISSGTGYTVKYAEQNGLRIINIAI